MGVEKSPPRTGRAWEWFLGLKACQKKQLWGGGFGRGCCEYMWRVVGVSKRREVAVIGGYGAKTHGHSIDGGVRSCVANWRRVRQLCGVSLKVAIMRTRVWGSVVSFTKWHCEGQMGWVA